MKTNPTPLLGTLKYLYQHFTSPFCQVRLLFLVCLVFQSVLLEKVSYFYCYFTLFIQRRSFPFDMKSFFDFKLESCMSGVQDGKAIPSNKLKLFVQRGSFLFMVPVTFFVAINNFRKCFLSSDSLKHIPNQPMDKTTT